MGAGRFLVAALLAVVSITTQAATRPRVQYAEKIALSASAGHAEFDAYGRRFALDLNSNDRALTRLRAAQPGSLPGYRLWRGALEGQPGSWTRLTEHDGRLEGVIWDGRDLYVVGSHAEVANYLDTPMAARPDDTVVFRLSDTLDYLPKGYCATEPTADGLAPNNGLVQYRNLVSELQVVAPTATQQIEIAMLADSRLQTQLYDAMTRMVASYNIVDGIYVEQLKLLVMPEVMRLIPASDDPFTATNGNSLLAQMSNYRVSHPELSALGITHLFTGAELDGDPIGIARIRGACDAADGVSLTQGWYGDATSTGLIMAHELGHNLGAEHDGSGSCASTPETFIMAPNLNGSTRFSQCSVTAIRNFVGSAPASCITAANYAHVELPQDRTTLNGEAEVPLVVPFDISSTGTRAADNVVLDLRLNPTLVMTAAPSGIVGCTPTSLGLRCEIGSIAGGTTRHLEFTFTPGIPGGFDLDATVSASNNQNTRNNTQRYTLNILSSVDASVAVATSTPTASFGDMVDIIVTVRSLKSRPARGLRVMVTGAGLTGLSADVPAGASCQFNVGNQGQTTCTLPDLDGGQMRQIVIHARATRVGTEMQGQVFLLSTNDNDSNNNNQAYFTMRVNAVHDVGLEDAMPAVPLTYNMPYEFKATLRSFGSQPVGGVRVDLSISMQDPAALNAITSVTIGGNACTRLANWHYDCVVGTMAGGEALTLSVKGVATGLGEARFSMVSYAAIQDSTSNDSLFDAFVVYYGLDASVSHSPSQLSGPEGAELSGSFAGWSHGVQGASNATATLELPVGVRFTSFFVRNTSTTSCSIVDPRHLRCVFNVPPNQSYQLVDYVVIGDTPGSYQGTATMVMAGDENPANDTVSWGITITPAIDVGLREFSMPGFVIAGHPVTVPFQVFSGSRPVPGAAAVVATNTSAQVDSLTTSVGSCTRRNTWVFDCAFGDLAPGSNVDLSAVISASSLMGSATLNLSVSAPTDNVAQNNQRSKSFQAVAEADMGVQVNQASVTGTAGSSISLPSIIVSRMGGEALQPKLRFTLPAGVSISGMSGALVICTGTREYECEIVGSIPTSGGSQLDLKVTANSAMSFTVPVSVSAANDLQLNNNSASFAVSVNAPAAPPPPPSSGGKSGGGGSGGGGRTEWTLLGALALMLLGRQRRWVAAQRPLM